jgi:hypothetical protein
VPLRCSKVSSNVSLADVTQVNDLLDLACNAQREKTHLDHREMALAELLAEEAKDNPHHLKGDSDLVALRSAFSVAFLRLIRDS